MKKLELKDFLSYSFIRELADAEENGILFVKSQADIKKNSYKSDICLLKNGKVRELTSDGKTGSIFYHGGKVYFTSKRKSEDEKEGCTDIYSLALDGGEAKKAFSFEYPVSRITFLSDNTLLVRYTADSRTKDMKTLKERREIEKSDEDWKEIDELPFYLNAAGFTANKESRIAVYDIRKKKFSDITPEGFAVNDVCISEDRKKALITATRKTESVNLYSTVFSCCFECMKTEMVLSEDEKMSVSKAFFLGSKTILQGSFMEKHGINQNDDFFILSEGKVEKFASWGESTYSSVGSDCRYGSNPSSAIKNGKYYFTTTLDDSSMVYCLSEDATISCVSSDGYSTDGFIVRDDAIYSVRMAEGKLEEIYKDEKCITKLNDKALKGKYVAPVEEFTFESGGVSLKGYVLFPKDFDRSKKYPAILDIHGGPKTVYGKVFYHEMQFWANEGYFVFFTNPRGSDGRGDEFADIRGKYGTIDYDDLMRLTDEVIARYPEIDKDRIGETGGSYGGFMSNWILGHTDRFKAIATQRSILNWLSFWGTSDIGPYFAEDQCGAKLLDMDIKGLLERSPLLGVIENAKTPTLIIHSEEDYRCPVEQGYQLLSILKEKNVESRMVMFHKENHELSRSGRPKSRIKRLEEITKWMDKHLK
ncbi:MAG TPA: S9 family peptidase [Candidatus Ornithospirochaeta avicola]|uniref:S9 family peptidase n=1 Tax=Candidatus Ornithospirochaeta avicola TaxID=2840896 RepID=A0A9D1TNG6_9SPIO|nr:S9 family peptidase [Candidatus Ornithospirochaeta avicola]